jgi:hypothetical protein
MRVYPRVNNSRMPELPAVPERAHFVDDTTAFHDALVRWWQHRIKLLRPIVLDALREAGVDPGALRWNRKAGCSCGCSPGFVSDNPGNRGATCWVEEVTRD